MKNTFLIIFSLALASCSTSTEETPTDTNTSTYYQTTGYAQGTTYNVIYNDKLNRDLAFAVDSILKEFDQQLSIYVDTSTISKVNQLAVGSSMELTDNPHFIGCFRLAKEVYNSTNHAFNPAVYPLVKYWGFLSFEQQDTNHQQYKIDSLLNLIDFSDSAIEIVETNNQFYLHKHVTTSLDFNAIAQGYSSDVIANFLDQLGIENYMVEVGGELITKGVNSNQETWKIGVDQPIENSKPGEQDFQIIVGLSNQSLVTSGNYRKFYEKDGNKYSHTINPKTGKPVEHQLLSATVVTENCALADAYATAFMVMGVAETQLFLEQNKKLNLEVYLIFNDSISDWNTWQTKGFDELIVQDN